jgi:hypothetical protein
MPDAQLNNVGAPPVTPVPAEVLAYEGTAGLDWHRLVRVFALVLIMVGVGRFISGLVQARIGTNDGVILFMNSMSNLASVGTTLPSSLIAISLLRQIRNREGL